MATSPHCPPAPLSPAAPTRVLSLLRWWSVRLTRRRANQRREGGRISQWTRTAASRGRRRDSARQRDGDRWTGTLARTAKSLERLRVPRERCGRLCTRQVTPCSNATALAGSAAAQAVAGEQASRKFRLPSRSCCCDRDRDSNRPGTSPRPLNTGLAASGFAPRPPASWSGCSRRTTRWVRVGPGQMLPGRGPAAFNLPCRHLSRSASPGRRLVCGRTAAGGPRRRVVPCLGTVSPKSYRTHSEAGIWSRSPQAHGPAALSSRPRTLAGLLLCSD